MIHGRAGWQDLAVHGTFSTSTPDTVHSIPSTHQHTISTLVIDQNAREILSIPGSFPTQSIAMSRSELCNDGPINPIESIYDDVPIA